MNEFEDGKWMYLTEWKFYGDVTWETADTLRAGAADVWDDFNENWSRKCKPGPKRKRKRPDDHMNKLPARPSAAFPQTAMRP